MKIREFKERLINGDMNRRMFSTALAAVGLTTIMQPMMSSPAKAAGDVNYFTWGGYDDEAFFQAYIAKHGGMPDFSFFASEDEGLAKIRAGFKPTIGHPCSDTVPRWARAGILKGIDTSRLSNYDALYPELTNMAGNFHNGETIFIPFDWGNSSIIYRTDLVDPKYNEEHTWELLFDERYAGRLAMYNSPGGASAVAGMLLGHSREDLWKPNDAQLEAIGEKLRQQQPLLRYYWDDQTTAEQGIASGELVASYAWNEAMLRLKEQGVPVEYMNPKEGILFWVCGLAMFNDEYGAGNEEAAYEMINEMMSYEVGKYVIDEWGYGHSNMQAFADTPEDRLIDLALNNPLEMMKTGVFFQDVPDEINVKMQGMFSEIQAGL